MDTGKKQLLNKIENLLYIVIVAAIVTDILSGQPHDVVFIISTAALIAGILGIISIEFVKLQWKQKRKNS